MDEEPRIMSVPAFNSDYQVSLHQSMASRKRRLRTIARIYGDNVIVSFTQPLLVETVLNVPAAAGVRVEPPKLAIRILGWLLPAKDQEEQIGDLCEVFEKKTLTASVLEARLWFIWEAMQLIVRKNRAVAWFLQKVVEELFRRISGV